MHISMVKRAIDYDYISFFKSIGMQTAKLIIVNSLFSSILQVWKSFTNE
jgi:hypothetical protein